MCALVDRQAGKALVGEEKGINGTGQRAHFIGITRSIELLVRMKNVSLLRNYVTRTNATRRRSASRPRSLARPFISVTVRSVGEQCSALCVRADDDDDDGV